MAEKISYEPLIQDDTTMAMVNSSPSNRFTQSGIFTNRPAVLSALIIILVMSLTANTLQFLHAFKTATAGGLSKYSRLSYDTNINWAFNSGEENQLQEDLLEGISLNDGAIAVSKEWAEEHDLGETSVFPWDESKVVYFIHAYHGLHCVKLIYRFVKEIRDQESQTIPLEHIIHCLDSMRKDIMCYADDTPRPRRYEPNSTVAIKANGELRQCRNWSALESWAKERSACFQAGNADPKDMLHSQLKYCPTNSPYLPAVRQYFGQGNDWYPLVDGQ